MQLLPPQVLFCILICIRKLRLVNIELPGLITRLLELARDEDLGIGGQPGLESESVFARGVVDTIL